MAASPSTTNPGARTARTPARAEAVGSLLRRGDVQRLLNEIYGGNVAPRASLPADKRARLAELDRAAAAATPQVVQRQIDAGLDVVTDGELRRTLFLDSFYDAVEGIAESHPTVTIHKDGKLETSDSPDPAVVAKLRKVANPALSEWADLSAATSFPSKLTFPAASYFSFPHYLEVQGDAYPDHDAMAHDAVGILEELVLEVIEAGVRHVQFDFPVYPLLVDADMDALLREHGETREGLLEKALAADKRILERIPEGVTTGLHLCRGNPTNYSFYEGSVAPIAERVFGELSYDRFLFEWDDVSRLGSFEPIKYVPKGRIMVMGLVSTKRPEIESEDEILRMMEQAAQHLDMDQLALSPQCGFGSSWLGRAYGEEIQWGKLGVVGSVAERIWGS